MANIISIWLGPNNFAVLRDKINAIVSILSGGSTGSVFAKYGTGDGEAMYMNLFDLFPTGQPWHTFETDLSAYPFGGKWVALDAKTLGNSSSSGDYKGDQYENLFLFLWNKLPSSSVSGGKGIDADSDWAANKKITLPDARGRSFIGYDARSSDPSTGFWDAAYNVMGGLFGEKDHTLVVGEGTVEEHDHSVLCGSANGGNPGVRIGIASSDGVQSLGQGYDDTNVSGGAKDAEGGHNTVHPVMVSNIIIKL